MSDDIGGLDLRKIAGFEKQRNIPASSAILIVFILGVTRLVIHFLEFDQPLVVAKIVDLPDSELLEQFAWATASFPAVSRWSGHCFSW